MPNLKINKIVRGKMEKRFYLFPFLAISLVFLVNCGVKLSPTGDSWFAKHYIIMQDWERDLYKSLSKEGRERFKQLFWQYRSPKAQELFENRLKVIDVQFKKENYSQPWNTDRGRIFLLNGSPAHIDYTDSTRWYVSGDYPLRQEEDIQSRMIEVWKYSYEGGVVEYYFVFYPPSEWRLDSTVYKNPFLKQFEEKNKDKYFGVVNKEKYEKELGELKKS